MSEAKKWSYVTALCYFRETKSAGLMGFMGALGEGYFMLSLEQDYSLNEGLNVMGSRGYELAGIQAAALIEGKEVGWYRPKYLYVFKRPESA